MLAGIKAKAPCIVGSLGRSLYTFLSYRVSDMMCSDVVKETIHRGGEKDRVWFPYRSTMQVNLSEGANANLQTRDGLLADCNDWPMALLLGQGNRALGRVSNVYQGIQPHR